MVKNDGETTTRLTTAEWFFFIAVLLYPVSGILHVVHRREIVGPMPIYDWVISFTLGPLIDFVQAIHHFFRFKL